MSEMPAGANPTTPPAQENTQPQPVTAPAPEVATPATAPSATQPAPNGHEKTSIDMLMDITLFISVELGRSNMTVRQVLDLQKGSVIELDRMAGDAVDIYVNDHLIARGDVVVVDDKFGVRVTELMTTDHILGDV